jgi:hypothetical protein
MEFWGNFSSMVNFRDLQYFLKSLTRNSQEEVESRRADLSAMKVNKNKKKSQRMKKL